MLTGWLQVYLLDLQFFHQQLRPPLLLWHDLHKFGDVVARDPAALPAGSHSIGERGIVPAGIGSVLVKKVKPSEAAAYRMDDLRVLPIKSDAQGVRRQDFPTAVSSMDDAEPSGGGIQPTGPPTALKLLKDMRDQAFTPSTFHEHWVRTAEIPKSDHSVFEHECLSRILESLVVVDQLNAPCTFVRQFGHCFSSRQG